MPLYAPTTLRFYTSLSSRCCGRKYVLPLRRGLARSIAVEPPGTYGRVFHNSTDESGRVQDPSRCDACGGSRARGLADAGAVGACALTKVLSTILAKRQAGIIYGLICARNRIEEVLQYEADRRYVGSVQCAGACAAEAASNAESPARKERHSRAFLGGAACSTARGSKCRPTAGHGRRARSQEEWRQKGRRGAQGAPSASKIKSYEDAVAGSMARRIVYTDTHNHSRRRPRGTRSRRRRPRRRRPRRRRGRATSTRPSPSSAKRNRPARTCPRPRSPPRRNRQRSSR